MKSKLKSALILLSIIVLCLSVGVYAGYTLTATEVSYTKPDGTTVSVKQALDELHEKSTETVAETTGTAIEFDWNELSTIAKMISNNSSITSNTLSVFATLNGKKRELRVGDTTTVDGKTVRILGFNHDTLTNPLAYGTTTATGKAGISFEYVDFINVDGNGTTTARMNSTDTNKDGWGASELRSTLNSTTYNSLSIKNNIKQVQKEFIPTYNNTLKSTSSDYLWFLSCGEIWDNGYNNGITRGDAIATEGSQYKYYKSTLGSTKYSSSTNITKKPNISNPLNWWLRSPPWKGDNVFCIVGSGGGCGNQFSAGVAPGFCI